MRSTRAAGNCRQFGGSGLAAIFDLTRDQFGPPIDATEDLRLWRVGWLSQWVDCFWRLLQ